MDANSTQSSGFYDLLAWLDANWKKVLMGAVAVVVVVAAIALYKWKKEQSEIDANKALLSLSLTGALGTNDVSPDQLARIAQEHPNTAAAERAQLLAAGAAFEKGDYAKSQALFDAIAKGNSAEALKAQAGFGIASSLEAQKNYDAALQKYQEIARQYPKDNVGPQSKLAIARIYETQNKPEEALKMYTEIQNQADQFEYWQGEAAERKDRLVARHPNLKEQAAAGEQVIEVTTPPAPATTNK